MGLSLEDVYKMEDTYLRAIHNKGSICRRVRITSMLG
ncbi:hypothetical protein QOZ91_003593 [Clostridium sardiniense]|nr:hypothetical protein [Clostridium sardiniense]